MKKKGQAIRNAVKGVLFCALAAGVLLCANFVLKLKSIDGCYVAQMFYRQPPDTVDVVFIGSSHIYTDVNPAVLWEEFGMSAYDLAGSNQPLWNTYYYMKEAIEEQTPDLVVIDMYRAIEMGDVIDDARIAMNTMGLKYGENRTESILASVADEEDAMNYILGIPVYHTKYESLTEDDFKRYNGDPNGTDYKGFNENCVSTTYFESFSDMSTITDTLPITKKSEEYLEKIIELAKETDTQLLLMVSPYQGIMPSDKMIYNRVREIAEEHGVAYVDFNDRYNEMGLSPMTDCAESSHLNYYGSEKFSLYLGRYLKNRYSIEDHRGDEAYRTWDRNAEHYTRIRRNFEARNTEDLGELLTLLLENEDYTFCVSADGLYDYGELDVKGIFASHGLKIEEGAVMVVEHGDVIFYADDKTEGGYQFHLDLGTKTLVIDGKPREVKDPLTGEVTEQMEKSVKLGPVNSVTAPHGINILIYDDYTKDFPDCAGFNALEGYKKIRY